MNARLRKALIATLVLAMTVIAVRSLIHQLHTVRLHDLEVAVAAIAWWRLGLAAALTALSYLVLTAYDVIAVRYIEHPLPYRKTAFASFLGYVFSYNVGLSVLGGGAVRLRLYSVWGLSTVEIAKIIAFAALTYWVGMTFVAGLSFVFVPVAIPELLGFRLATSRPIGALLLAAFGAYLAFVLLYRRPIKLGRWTIALPSPAITGAQVVVASADLLIASLVCFTLLPGDHHFAAFIGAYALAVAAAMVSHVPGGIGVFEGVLLALVPGDTTQLLAGLLCYRIVYYLIPLGFAAILLGGHELRGRRPQLAKAGQRAAKVVFTISPTIVAAAVAMVGVVLSLSSAIVTRHHRFALVADAIPLAPVELSHFGASIVGLLLVVLAFALVRRLDGAWWLTVVLLGAAALSMALSGLRYEEASAILIALFALITTRKSFYRRSNIMRWRPDPASLLAGALTLVGAGGLFFVMHRSQLSEEVWWQFGKSAGASRSLRGLAGASVVLLALSLRRLLGQRPAMTTAAAPEVVEQARPLVAACPRSIAHLALLGDKAVLMSEQSDAFIMYGSQGRSAIALGDPVGLEASWRGLIWSFRDLADERGLSPVFYQTGPKTLYHYIEQGFTAFKLGEEARVPIHNYTLDGGAHKKERQSLHRMETAGATFEIVPAAEVPVLLKELRQVSDNWLSDKNAAEKRFSLGYFDEAYLCRTPVAVVRTDAGIQAFANVWLSGDSEELAPDLMRYQPDAPQDVMSFLFTQLMLYGRDQGYRWFNLGMAPLSGLDDGPLAPLWNRAGALLYRHGEHFYNYQGLRRFKEGFHPEWEPRYLTARGGLSLPRTLVDVAALISGGVTKSLRK